MIDLKAVGRGMRQKTKRVYYFAWDTIDRQFVINADFTRLQFEQPEIILEIARYCDRAQKEKIK
jgi:hypothetical protein